MGEQIAAWFILWSVLTFLILPLVFIIDSYINSVKVALAFELSIVVIGLVVFAVSWAFKVLGA